MTARPPRAVAELLLQAMPQLSERLAERAVRRDWAALVGPEIARRSRPRGFSGGVLTVIVDNSPWLQELTLRAPDLTVRLRERVPGLHTLRVAFGRLDGDDEMPEAPSRRAPAPLSASDCADIDAAAAAIADPTVAAAARRVLTTARRFPVT